MTAIRASMFTLLLLVAAAAPAQQAGGPIERQMSPEQFKAAGLEKLTPAELANLNAWLNRTVEAETAKAAVAAKKEVEVENRGFFHFGSRDPITAALVGEFKGFGKGRTYTLDNGQVWRQLDSASLAGIKLTAPRVSVKPALIGNNWYLGVEGYNARALVERIK